MLLVLATPGVVRGEIIIFGPLTGCQVSNSTECSDISLASSSHCSKCPSMRQALKNLQQGGCESTEHYPNLG